MFRVRGRCYVFILVQWKIKMADAGDFSYLLVDSYQIREFGIFEYLTNFHNSQVNRVYEMFDKF